MDAKLFWELVKKSKRGTDNCEEQSEQLSQLLAELDPQEIVDFDRHMRQRLIEVYRWDLWAVAYILNGGCSDDGFEYFRGWLVAQGKEYFELALKNPETAAKKVSPGDVAECEGILSVARTVYEQKTGEALPPSSVQKPSEPTGQRWQDDELKTLYPKLAKKYG